MSRVRGAVALAALHSRHFGGGSINPLALPVSMIMRGTGAAASANLSDSWLSSSTIENFVQVKASDGTVSSGAIARSASDSHQTLERIADHPTMPSSSSPPAHGGIGKTGNLTL